MRVLLADGHEKVRFALRTVLERRPGLEIVGEAADLVELLCKVEAERPDLILLDWHFSGQVTAELLRALRQIQPNMLILALSVRPEARRAALSTGVDAFACKADPPERLISTIDELLAGALVPA